MGALPPDATIDSPEVQSKIRELIRLAKEQSYITYDDLNEALPCDIILPDLVEEIIAQSFLALVVLVALSPPAHRELSEALDGFASDASLRVAVINPIIPA